MKTQRDFEHPFAFACWLLLADVNRCNMFYRTAIFKMQHWQSNLPAELISAYSTLEYQLPARVEGPPIFLFCVDTCILEEEIDELKDSLQVLPFSFFFSILFIRFYKK